MCNVTGEIKAELTQRTNTARTSSSDDGVSSKPRRLHHLIPPTTTDTEVNGSKEEKESTRGVQSVTCIFPLRPSEPAHHL